VDLAVLASNQMWPVLGGVLEQSTWFIKATSFVLQMKELIDPEPKIDG
jgi:hypothetical protein